MGDQGRGQRMRAMCREGEIGNYAKAEKEELLNRVGGIGNKRCASNGVAE